MICRQNSQLKTIVPEKRFFEHNLEVSKVSKANNWQDFRCNRVTECFISSFRRYTYNALKFICDILVECDLK